MEERKLMLHWYKKWPEGSKDWVKATTIKELESADLPFFTLSEAKSLRMNILCNIRTQMMHMLLL